MAKAQNSKVPKLRDGKPPAKSQEPAAIVLGSADDLEPVPSGTRSIGGSASKCLNMVLVSQAMGAVWLPAGTSDSERNRLFTAAATALTEFKPKDGIEGMMAAQAFGLHTAAMECLRRAMIPDQPFEAADRMRRQGANLSRAFLDVLAGLDRKRGKGGHQTVRIERVQIAPGGHAAIVGTVNTGQGGGDGKETRGEPHEPAASAGQVSGAGEVARLAHDASVGSVLFPLRSENAGRDPVPIARDEQRPVPDARREQHRP
jgi:hypothetical protein